MFAQAGAAWIAGAEMFAVAALIAASIVFERRYRTRRAKPQDQWQSTNERFFDPTSGKLMRVQYNPRTGERSYEEID